MNGKPPVAGARVAATPVATARSTVPVQLVDDNPAKRLALAAALSPLGWAIVEADSGLAALRAILVQDFAVILLDVHMPDIDGFETAALIRKRHQSEMTPIIFITASAVDEIAMKDRYAEGAIDFIFSPVQPYELRAKVSAFASIFRRAEVLATRAREVQASADQLRLLTDAAPIGIFQTDDQNRYTYTNPHWSLLTGIPAEVAAGQAWETILSPEQRADLIVERVDPASGPAQFCHRFEITFPGSASRIVLLTSRPISGNRGGTVGWVGTLADVTADVTAKLAMSHAHVALEELNLQLTVVARHDPLTGLNNRRALREDLDQLEARTLRYGHRYCLAILDIDHFKTFNDTYGHQAGDVALQAVATHLSEQVRAGDALYRYGGEEFLCVFPEQSVGDATLALERMRGGIERLAIPHTANPWGVVTISAGLATLDPSNHRSAGDVLKEADEDLYRAKQAGRNRVGSPAAAAQAASPNPAA